MESSDVLGPYPCGFIFQTSNEFVILVVLTIILQKKESILLIHMTDFRFVTAFYQHAAVGNDSGCLAHQFKGALQNFFSGNLRRANLIRAMRIILPELSNEDELQYFLFAEPSRHGLLVFYCCSDGI